MFALVTAFSANNFSSAVLPFAGAPALDRAAVVLTLGGGFGLFVVGFAALRELTAADTRWRGARTHTGPRALD